MTGFGKILLWIVNGAATVLAILGGLWPVIGYILAALIYFSFKGTAFSDIAFFVMMGFALMIFVMGVAASERNANPSIDGDRTIWRLLNPKRWLQSD